MIHLLSYNQKLRPVGVSVSSPAGLFISERGEYTMYSSNITVTASGVVRLLLKNKHYKSRRAIGWFEDEGDSFHTKRNPSHHLFHKLNAYGVNYDLLNEGSFTWVVIELPFDQTPLITSRKYFLSKGSLLNFKKNQLERQLFLPISEFGIENAQRYENDLLLQKSELVQNDLFAEVA